MDPVRFNMRESGEEHRTLDQEASKYTRAAEAGTSRQFRERTPDDHFGKRTVGLCDNQLKRAKNFAIGGGKGLRV